MNISLWNIHSPPPPTPHPQRRKVFEKISEFTYIVNNTTFITLMQNLQGDIEVARIFCICLCKIMFWYVMINLLATCEVTSYVLITRPSCSFNSACCFSILIYLFCLLCAVSPLLHVSTQYTSYVWEAIKAFEFEFEFMYIWMPHTFI